MFRNLMYRLQRFMYGRYGGDALNIFLLVLAFLFSFAAQISGVFWLLLPSYALEIWFLFRAFSRNIAARRRELAVFMRVWGPVGRFFTQKCGGWFRFQAEKYRYRAVYRYFKCPKCHQRLRAPRNRGKILVTCQRCKTQFTKKV